MAKDVTIDLSKLSLEQLRALVPAAQQRIEELEEEQRQQAFDKVQAAAAEVGMSPTELLKHFGVGARAKKPAKPKYRNPENHDETWSGRGRKPEWVVAWLEDGKKLAELAMAQS